MTSGQQSTSDDAAALTDRLRELELELETIKLKLAQVWRYLGLGL